MIAPSELCEALHDVIERHENRGLIPALKGADKLGRPLLEAAKSLLGDRGGRVAICTGFFIPSDSDPRPETDGPIGAAQLAHFLALSGWRPEIITDGHCAEASLLCRNLVQGEYEITVLSDPDLIEQHKAAWEAGTDGPKHVISIERAGPNSEGKVTNIRGKDITDFTPPLHKLFEKDVASKVITISLADGENEIGAGNLLPFLQRSHGAAASNSLCIVPVDYLVLGAVSNWNAVALASAITILDKDLAPNLTKACAPEVGSYLLERLTEDKVAVDGVIGDYSATTVDGFDIELSNNVTRDLLRVSTTRTVIDGAV